MTCRFQRKASTGWWGGKLKCGNWSASLKANSVVLLSGDTGVGKTELALGLCRWFLKPARVVYPGGVFYTVFEASQPAGTRTCGA